RGGTAGSRRDARLRTPRRRARARPVRDSERGAAGAGAGRARGPRGCRAAAGAAARRARGQRLDAGQRQLLPRDPHREDHDVAHPAADRRGGRLQHRRHAGDGGHRQAHRHRHHAHLRRRAGAGAHGARDRVPGGARGAHRAGRSAALRVAMSAYEWLIGTRYLRSTHRRGFVSFVALISVCGLTLGVATLIVVLSVMNGFERELRSRILAVTSHATLMGLSGALPDWRALQQQIRRQSGVEAAVPYVESLCVLANGRRLAAAKVRGVLPEEERSATGLAHRVISGSLDDLRDGSYAAILGSALAHELDARVGDTVVLIAPEGTA